VKDLRREARDLKELVAEQTLELRLLKKSMTGDKGDPE
jgi:transposase